MGSAPSLASLFQTHPPNHQFEKRPQICGGPDAETTCSASTGGDGESRFGPERVEGLNDAMEELLRISRGPLSRLLRCSSASRAPWAPPAMGADGDIPELDDKFLLSILASDPRLDL